MSDVTDNTAARRYELEVEGQIAIATYDDRGGARAITHTGVPAALEGRGIGSRLIKAALTDIRAKGMKVIPACPFVSAYIDRHPEDADLLADTNF